jgi:membrane-associated phospholipid phosphatase
MTRRRDKPDLARIADVVEEADLATAHRVADWRHHPVVAGLGRLSELADQPPLYTLAAGTAALGAMRGDARLFRAGLRMLAAQWLATEAKTIIKRRVDRTRPHVPVEGGTYRMEPGKSREKALSSFPSGHTAGAVAVARAYASEYPEFTKPAVAAAVLVGLIQVPRCKHFLTDIAAGAVIGLGAGALVEKR